MKFQNQQPGTEQPIKVSVCMITYGHEKYIRKAVESALSQKTDFEVELVVGNDCSPDNTDQILKDIIASHPQGHRINYISHSSNIGMMPNFLKVLSNCKGKYIALLDGDDFWSDNRKLQKQYDFLEENEDYSLCFHDVYFEINGKRQRNFQWDAPEVSDIHYLLRKGNYITTVSAVFRNDKGLHAYLAQMQRPPLADYLIYVYTATKGKIKFIKDIMATYRVHSGGNWSQIGLDNAMMNSFSVIRFLYSHLPELYQNDLRIQLLSIFEVAARENSTIFETQSNAIEELCRKMEIPAFNLEYIKFSSTERSTPAYYSKNVLFPVLVKAIREKLRTKILKK